MKKDNQKIYIITSLIILIFSVLTVINKESILATQIESINELKESLDVSYLQTPTSSASILVEGILGIIASFVMLYYAKYKDLKEAYIIPVISNLIVFFTASYNIVSLCSVLNIILLLVYKKKKPKEEKELPVLEAPPSNLKLKILSLALVAIYFSQIPLSYILPDIGSNSIFYDLGFDIIMLICVFIVYGKEIINGLKIAFKNLKQYVPYCLKTYAIFFVLYFVLSLISVLVKGGETSVNQSLLNTLPMWYLFISAVFIAPFVEESLFRGVVRRFINHKWAYIIISGLIFGALHAIHEENLFNMIIVTLPYASLGSCFAYVYYKTNNISCNILMHMTHNLVTMLLMLLTM